jgi:hypothetical protein
MHLQSRLEDEASMLIETNSTIIESCEQPDLNVHAWIDGEYRESIPDFWLRRSDGTIVIVEVKYDEDLEDPESRAHRQIRVQQDWCSAKGYTHVIMKYSDIWQNPILMNSLRALLAIFRPDYPDRLDAARNHTGKILGLVASHPGQPIRDLEKLFREGTERELVRLMICDLIRTHVLDAGIERTVLNPNSQLFLGRVIPT